MIDDSFGLACITSQYTDLGHGVMPYIDYAWGDANIWEAYFTCDIHLNKSDIFMSLVTFCNACISVMEVTRVILFTVLCYLQDAEFASSDLWDTSSLLSSYHCWLSLKIIWKLSFLCVRVCDLNTAAFVFDSQWTMLILSFQWKLMEQFTRYALDMLNWPFPVLFLMLF